MFDILSAFYHDDPLSLGVLSSIEDPQIPEEHMLRTQLRAVSEEAAKALAPHIEALANRQAERAFYSGVRFGAQLMAQLLEELP